MNDDFFTRLAPYQNLAVAVSGGSDSLALLVLVKDWAFKNNRKITVLTVDHGLRKEAEEEALYVADLCDKLGLSHYILKWQAEKPVSALQKEAREARYDLMARFCVEHNIPVLLLGHTQNDQAETALMRLRRARHHNRGLSAMAQKTFYRVAEKQEIIFMRPLLSVQRNDLRKILQERHINWVEDPSNENTDFERVRARRFLAERGELNKKIIDFTSFSGRYRAVLSGEAARVIELCCNFHISGGVQIEKEMFFKLPEPVQVLIMQSLFSALGGESHFQPYKKIVDVLREQKPVTLGHVLSCPDKECFFLVRENRNLPDFLFTKNAVVQWDNRYKIILKHSSPVEICSGKMVCDRFTGDADYFFVNYPEKITRYTKQGFLTMPWMRFCDKDEGSERFIPLPFICHDALTMRHCLGAFERYCLGFDEALYRVMQRLFTFSPLKG